MEFNLLKLAKKHVKKASRIFTEAFSDYPLFKYMVENQNDGPKIYPLFFKLMTSYTVYFGEAYATSEDMEGIALWLPSDKSDISLWSNLMNGGVELVLKAGLRVTYKSMVFTDFASKLHHSIIDEPHLYLFQIGVF